MLRLLLTIACLIGIGWTSHCNAADKPNILFLFADDQAFDTLHARGNDEIETPHLDELVKRGTTFTHAYNMGSWSGAVCVASRTMLTTGRTLWHANAVYNKTEAEAEREAGRFWPVLMKNGGYETYFTGKWHVRAKAELAFDHTGHVRGGMPNQTPAGYNRPQSPGDTQWQPWDKQFGGFWQGGKHWSEVVADDALGFLKHARTADKPFFMYIAFNAPHDPRQSPKEYVDRYPLDKIAIPDSYQAEYPYKEDIGAGKGLRDEKLAPFPRTKYAVKVHRQEYYAIITHMDEQIGRILKALKDSGKEDNTYIVFTADHGLAVGRHGLMGKQNMYDHSVRVPLMIVGPNIPAGKTLDTRVYLQDVVPTTLELADIKQPEHVEFRSLLPVIHGKRDEQYDAIYGAYLQLQRMITMGDDKLILYPKARKARLYNVKTDPQELKDLAGDPASQPTIRKLFAKLLQMQKANGDKLDLKTPFADLLQD